MARDNFMHLHLAEHQTLLLLLFSAPPTLPVPTVGGTFPAIYCMFAEDEAGFSGLERMWQETFEARGPAMVSAFIHHASADFVILRIYLFIFREGQMFCLFFLFPQ